MFAPAFLSSARCGDCGGPRASLFARLRWGAVLPVLALFLLVGCESSTDADGDPEFQLQDVIQSLAATGASVSTRPGTPDEDPEAPTAQVQGGTSIIPGGGSGFTVSANSDFSVVYVGMEGRSGYYEIDFGAPRSEAEIVMTYNEALEDEDYSFRFMVGSGSGAGAATTSNLQVVSVGTGDVQVSVSWDVPSDVDLYVVEPSGEEIFYGNRSSATGGQLDLDSNAACGGQDVRNENITWPDDPAPRGDYQVRVNYWDNCGQARTSYVVTVQVRGQPVRTYQGVLTGNGTGGASGAGEVITTFTY